MAYLRTEIKPFTLSISWMYMHQTVEDKKKIYYLQKKINRKKIPMEDNRLILGDCESRNKKKL